ncbi:hypothetical protein AgCh_037873 [Apium graveolens]
MEEQFKILLETSTRKQEDQIKRLEDNMIKMMQVNTDMKEQIKSSENASGRQEVPINNDSGTISGVRSLSFLPKLEFPKFDGSNPRVWIKKATKYFELCKIQPDERVDLASLHMLDKAENWVTSYLAIRKNVEWGVFTEDLTARFKEENGSNIVEQFNKLMQNESLQKYIDDFEDLRSVMIQINHILPKNYILDSFIGGLKPSVKPFVRAFKPETISQAIEYARLQEESLAVISQKSTRYSFNNAPKPIQSIPMLANSKPPLLPTPATKPDQLALTKFNPRQARNNRFVPADVRAEKIAKGLCYFCDQPYERGHKCKFRESQLFTVEVPGDVEQIDEEREMIQSVLEESEPCISVSTLAGGQNFQTMRIRGITKNKVISILVDSGSTHNFVDVNLAKSLNCDLESIDTQSVTVADGNHIPCNQVCKSFCWEMGGRSFSTEAMLIPLGGCDMILGVQWLSTLGPVKWDFKKLKMEFVFKGAAIKLQGVPCQKLKVLDKPPSSKLLKQAAQLCFIQVQELFVTSHNQSVQSSNPEKNKHGSELEKLQKEFAVIFAEPDELPPHRGIYDHEIPLEPNARSVNIRPYSELNKKTVKDKFPIPVIDELIDELAGAQCFSKLDLRAGYHQLRLHPDEMYAKQSKCFFAVDKVEYLGHFISGKGIETDPSKISVVDSWPVPRSVKELRSFLGLTGYYRKFVRGYATINRNLTDLLKKGNFQWNELAQESFEKLKLALTTAPVLAIPDFNKEFMVETDASKTGIGAVLMQDSYPLAFISRALGTKWQKLSVYEKELLAIVFAVQKWEQYLTGNHFIIKTDQKSLKWLLRQKISTPFQQFWLSKLLGFDYEIQYKQGKENLAADALSRVTNAEVLCWAISAVSSNIDRVIQESYILDDNIMKKGKIPVGPDSQLKTKILNWHHNAPGGGHSGRDATIKRIKTIFTWKGLSKDVKEFVRNCQVCQTAKYDTAAFPGLLQPLPVPQEVWLDISMDFITGLPKSNGKDVILVIVDRLSKYGHFLALAHPFTAIQVAQLYLDNVFKLHGWPKSTVSDRDSVFLSDFWKNLFLVNGTEFLMSSAYHPATDGQTEVVNRCLETYLRCMCGDHVKDWNMWLPLAEGWYNTNFHTAIGLTPYEVVYNQQPPLHLPYLAGESTNEVVDRSLEKRELMISELKFQLIRAQNRMKSQADKHRSDRIFQVNDWVWLKLQPYRQLFIHRKTNQKLARKYYGPFQVESVVGKVAYKLKLPDSVQVHRVFHVSLLKPFYGSPHLLVSLPDWMSKSDSLGLKPQAVLQTRVSCNMLEDWRRAQEEMVKNNLTRSSTGLWVKPPAGWMKINVDAACNQYMGIGGVGCVQGNREFVNEIGMITALQHPHLVKLYGCCIEGPDKWQIKLDWATRYKICTGIAKGLAYLHEESRLKIIHRDIKATNVLLDKELNPKISDFGLAKLVEEEKTHMSTRVAGTYGYMAPEYAMRGTLTDKADVYSFGIVALEIVSGMSNTSSRSEQETLYLLDWISLSLFTFEDLLRDLVDERLGSEFNEKEATLIINLALLCTNVSPVVRPAMSLVVGILEGRSLMQDYFSDRSSNSEIKQPTDFLDIQQQSYVTSSSGDSQLKDESMTYSWTASPPSRSDLYPINVESNSRK